ncbi:uncharacterized protein LOC135823398 [Sycon ciliatum]|uniref:uncharacterized protein LOC135823398 n=1 Tax=Sycon ciliatum TaxID=27933 RepID=UPI0031F6E498
MEKDPWCGPQTRGYSSDVMPDLPPRNWATCRTSLPATLDKAQRLPHAHQRSHSHTYSSGDCAPHGPALPHNIAFAVVETDTSSSTKSAGDVGYSKIGPASTRVKERVDYMTVQQISAGDERRCLPDESKRIRTGINVRETARLFDSTSSNSQAPCIPRPPVPRRWRAEAVKRANTVPGSSQFVQPPPPTPNNGLQSQEGVYSQANTVLHVRSLSEHYDRVIPRRKEISSCASGVGQSQGAYLQGSSHPVAEPTEFPFSSPVSPKKSPLPNSVQRVPGIRSAPSSPKLVRKNRLPKQEDHHSIPVIKMSVFPENATDLPKQTVADEEQKRMKVQASQRELLRPLNILINDVSASTSKQTNLFPSIFHLKSFAYRLGLSGRLVEDLIGNEVPEKEKEKGAFYASKMHKVMIAWKNRCQLQGECDLEVALFQHLGDSGLSSLVSIDDTQPGHSKKVGPYTSRTLITSPLLRESRPKAPSPASEDSGFMSGNSTKSITSRPSLSSIELGFRGMTTLVAATSFDSGISGISPSSTSSDFEAILAGQLKERENLDTAFSRSISHPSFDSQNEEPLDTGPAFQYFSQTIDLSSQQLTNEQFQAVVPDCLNNTNVTRVTLNGNRITSSASVCALSDVLLKSSSTLTYVDLSDNQFGDEGLRCLLPAFSKCTLLETVMLRNCKLSSNALPCLSNISVLWPRVQELDIGLNDFSVVRDNTRLTWLSLAHRIRKLNVADAGVPDEDMNVINSELKGHQSGITGGKRSLPHYVRDLLTNGIYIGSEGGQLRHGPVLLEFPQDCVSEPRWVKWPRLTFYGRNLSFQGQEVIMGPTIELGPSQEFDRPVSIKVNDSRMNGNQESIALFRSTCLDLYDDISCDVELNVEEAFLKFSTLHFSEFRCGFCEKSNTAGEGSVRERLKQLTSEDLTILLNDFDRKQVLVFTAEYLEFEENFQVCLKLRTVPIAYREHEESEKCFKPNSGFLWTGAPYGRYPVLDPVQYNFHVLLKPSSADVRITDSVSTMVRNEPLEVTSNFVVRRPASGRLQGRAVCHFTKKDSPDGMEDSVLFYVDIPAKGGNRHRALFIDSTGQCDFRDVPIEKPAIEADGGVTQQLSGDSYEGHENPWTNPRFDREFYKKLLQINPTLFRIEAITAGLLTDQMSRMLLASQNSDPFAHNIMLLDFIKPNGITSFRQLLSVVKEMNYEPLWTGLNGLLPTSAPASSRAVAAAAAAPASANSRSAFPGVPDIYVQSRDSSPSPLPLCPA